jgi:hypothetical protein
MMSGHGLQDEFKLTTLSQTKHSLFNFKKQNKITKSVTGEMFLKTYSDLEFIIIYFVYY